MNGLEATRILKPDLAAATIPVIVLTAHARPEDRARAVAPGCDACPAKPAEPKTVLREVERLLAQRDYDPTEAREGRGAELWSGRTT